MINFINTRLLFFIIVFSPEEETKEVIKANYVSIRFHSFSACGPFLTTLFHSFINRRACILKCVMNMCLLFRMGKKSTNLSGRKRLRERSKYFSLKQTYILLKYSQVRCNICILFNPSFSPVDMRRMIWILEISRLESRYVMNFYYLKHLGCTCDLDLVCTGWYKSKQKKWHPYLSKM